MLTANIKKRLGSSNGFVLDVDLTVGDGVTVLFGHSGAGKTTILRSIAGVVVPDAGRITLNGQTFFDSAATINMPIQERRVGYVFQHHALFPHFTVEQNVAYGSRHKSVKPRSLFVKDLLALAGIEHTAARYPRELSGGEQQRVALARALASDPLIMLLDEPLSAVDVSTRSRLLEQISLLQRKSNIPFLYVTHNANEAVRVGDCVFIVEAGQIVQSGIPLEVFNAPQTVPVARAVGTENIFLGKVSHHRSEDGITIIDLKGCRVDAPYNGLPAGTEVSLGIRSEDIIVAREHLTQTSARNVLKGVVRHIICGPDQTELVVDCGIDLKVSVTAVALRELALTPGVEVYLLIKARAFHLLV